MKMRTKKRINKGLKLFSQLIMVIGAFYALGLAGSLELDRITISQFFLYELATISVTIITYFIIEVIRRYFVNHCVYKIY